MGQRQSRFASGATAEEIASSFDLTSRYYVVTGGNCGLGLESVRVLALRGAHVIACARRVIETEQAINGLNLPADVRARIEVEPLDLGRLDSIYELSVRLRERFAHSGSLDGLLLNAGIMALPEYRPTADGFESQWGVNHLGHMAFSLALLPCLVAPRVAEEFLFEPSSFLSSSSSFSSSLFSPPPPRRSGRVVVVSSAAHQRSPVFAPELIPPSAENYSPFPNYGLSKLSNILFASELNRRLFEPHGVAAFSLHPGVIPTDLGRHNDLASWFYSFPVTRMFMKNTEQGTSTQIYCLLESLDRLAPGGFYQDNDIAQPRQDALDPTNAATLWNTSISLLQDRFPRLIELVAADGIVSIPEPTPSSAPVESGSSQVQLEEAI